MLEEYFCVWHAVNRILKITQIQSKPLFLNARASSSNVPFLAVLALMKRWHVGNKLFKQILIPVQNLSSDHETSLSRLNQSGLKKNLCFDEFPKTDKIHRKYL